MDKPDSFACLLAASIATGERSMPVTTEPALANSSARRPPPHPTSRTAFPSSEPAAFEKYSKRSGFILCSEKSFPAGFHHSRPHWSNFSASVVIVLFSLVVFASKAISFFITPTARSLRRFAPRNHKSKPVILPLPVDELDGCLVHLHCLAPPARDLWRVLVRRVYSHLGPEGIQRGRKIKIVDRRVLDKEAIPLRVDPRGDGPDYICPVVHIYVFVDDNYVLHISELL